MGLTPYLDRKPNELSGGQRQRVALARAMVKKPAVFLMDEPLSNLDAKLRASMRTELIELQHRLGTTFVYVTHDQIEAMSMADTIVLMEKGEIQQIGTPREVYHKPANLFTAQFIGTPPMNIMELQSGRKVGIRPEKLNIAAEPDVTVPVRIKGEVVTREMLGSETQYKVKTARYGTLMVKSTEEEFTVGDVVYLNAKAKHVHCFDQEGKRIPEVTDALIKEAEELNND